MKKILFMLMVLVATLACKSECDECKGDQTVINVGDALPSFSVKALDGDFVFDSQPPNHPVLIYFLWSECGDCHKQTPEMLRVWNSVSSSGREIEFVCIARGGGNATLDMAKAYWHSLAPSIAPLEMPKLYYDEDRAVYNKFAKSGVPRLYLVDSEGIVRWISADITSGETLAEQVELVRQSE